MNDTMTNDTDHVERAAGIVSEALGKLLPDVQTSIVAERTTETPNELPAAWVWVSRAGLNRWGDFGFQADIVLFAVGEDGLPKLPNTGSPSAWRSLDAGATYGSLWPLTDSERFFNGAPLDSLSAPSATLPGGIAVKVHRLALRASEPGDVHPPITRLHEGYSEPPKPIHVEGRRNAHDLGWGWQ